ncbi:hypothetical protein LTR15_012053 [Elasticomyces elasticus]|nr:hypothetical protein LTR15_012053 [Elasticomyces elasticus]
MVTKLSLLVHAGAPSKRSDDDRARMLAEAYLEFAGRVVSEQTYRIPELALSQQLSELHNDSEDGTKYPTQLLRSSPPAKRVEDEVSMSVVQPAYDDTTFLEDTQDAYAALESQIQTSSLAIPDVTPLNRRVPESFDPDSPWPEDLDRHSPVKAANQLFVRDEDVEEEQQSQQISHEESPLQQRSQQVSPEEVSRTHEPPSQVVERPVVKKPRLQQRRVPAAKPVFKPFRPPTITRAMSDVTRAITPDVGLPVTRAEKKSVSQTSESQDSYLRTPVLVTPSQGWVAAARTTKSHGLGVKVSETTRTGTEGVVKTLLPEFRGQSPKRQVDVPYIPFPAEDGTGVAFIGVGQQLDPRTPSGIVGDGGGGGGERHSQFSGSGSGFALDTTSELPTSYSLSEISEQSSRARVGLRGEERSVSDPGAIGSNGRGDGQGQGQGERLSGDGEDGTKARSQLGKEDVRRVDGEVLEKRTDCLTNPAPGTRVGTSAAATILATPANPKVTKDNTSNGLPNTTALPPPKPAAESPFFDLPLTIRPPEPDTGVEDFTTHITPTLSYLSSSPQLKEAYTPVSVSRPIRPLERGHWLVDTSPWPTEAQIAFWRFLETWSTRVLAPGVRTTNPIRDGYQSAIKIHRPASKPFGGSPLIVLLHGGGFVAGLKDQLTGTARGFARQFGAVVVNLSYRMGPEYKWPVPSNDARDSVKWIAEHAAELGADPSQAFIVGGLSTGACSSLAIANLAVMEGLRVLITGLWLGVPALMDERMRNANAPTLDAAALAASGELDGWDDDSPLRLPVLFRGQVPLSSLPPTYFQVCGADPLRDDGLIYDTMLKEAGVKTKVDFYPGCPSAWALGVHAGN